MQSVGALGFAGGGQEATVHEATWTRVQGDNCKRYRAPPRAVGVHRNSSQTTFGLGGADGKGGGTLLDGPCCN